MLRLLKKSWWVILLAAGTQTAPAFTLLGNREPYMVGQLGYIGDYSEQPKNLSEGFRWTIPKLYYTYDASFWDYFGSNGVASVDEGIDILNQLPPVSSITNLDVYPLDSMRANYTAQAMRLFDLKSATLEMLVERLGLADPERFTWTLRHRALPPGASCPAFVYSVIKRNFDPDTLAPSSFVNGNLYTYTILEDCPVRDVAEAVEFLVDPFGTYLSAVASAKIMFGMQVYWGYYYNGLTRDDVGGLRYLLRPSNMYASAAGPNTYTFSTNRTTSQLLVTSNLTTFSWQALTNDAPGLQALYPNLVILNTTNVWTNIYVTNLTAYYTNYPWDPVGSFPRLKLATNTQLTVETRFQHTFGNLFTVSNTAPNTWIPVPLATVHDQISRQFYTVEVSYVTNQPYAPIGTVVTNTPKPKTFGTNAIGGEYFILPTNSCSVSILFLQATLTNRYTNIVISATNDVAGGAGGGGGTNLFTNNVFYTESHITYSTNHAFIINPVQCDTNSVAVRQGIDKVSFLRRDYDSLLNRFFYPITNTYFLKAVTNYTLITQTVQRIVTQPDILFDAADIATGPTTWPIINPTVSRQFPNFVTASGTGGTNLYGPGTIEPTVNFTFNKVGPLYYNFGPFFVDERTAELDFIWASFDGTTNPPVVYPIGTSIDNLTNQVFMYIANSALPNARVNIAYSVQLMPGGSGGTAPYSWSLSPRSPALPLGIELTAAGVIRTTNPTALQPNIYDFVVRMQDANSRYVDRAFTLTILP